jgi:hypothetical protein
MKQILTVVLAFLLVAFMPSASFAQTGTGKSGVAEVGGSMSGGKGGPSASEVVVANSNDSDQAVENLADPVDPVGNPAGFLDTLLTWWRAGWFLPFSFALGFGLVTYAARYVTWLGATPKRALVMAAATTFFGEVVARLATGAPFAAPIILAALGSAFNVWANGGKAAQRSADGVAAKFGPA